MRQYKEVMKDKIIVGLLLVIMGFSAFSYMQCSGRQKWKTSSKRHRANYENQLLKNVKILRHTSGELKKYKPEYDSVLRENNVRTKDADQIIAIRNIWKEKYIHDTIIEYCPFIKDVINSDTLWSFKRGCEEIDGRISFNGHTFSVMLDSLSFRNKTHIAIHSSKDTTKPWPIRFLWPKLQDAFASSECGDPEVEVVFIEKKK